MKYKTNTGRVLELDAELTKADMEKMGLSKPSPFDRVDRGEHYMFADSKGKVDVKRDLRGDISSARLATANYTTDAVIASRIADMEIAIRAMLKFSIENGGEELIKGGATKVEKFYIKYRKNGKRTGFFVDDNYMYSQVSVPFASREVAEKFIEEHKELLEKALGLK